MHQDLKINVRFKHSNAFGSLVWKGKGPTEFSVEDIVSSAQLQLGDTIVTGGMSSYFPYGIPLGTITHIENDSNSGYYIMTAELFENPSLEDWSLGLAVSVVCKMFGASYGAFHFTVVT